MVIWDSMIDEYIFWNTDRKNPESPMPLLSVEREEMKLGWASNVANNISSLMWSVDLISVIGDDENGEKLKRLSQQSQIHLIPIIWDAPTITKKRFVDSQYQQQLLRVDYERKISLNVDHIKQITDILQASKPEYVLISDYNKWMITIDLVHAIKQFSAECWSKLLVDTKPQHIDFFQWVYLIKPNFKEFCEMIGNKGMENTDINIEKYWPDFTKKYKTNLVVTRGSKWASVVTFAWHTSHVRSLEEYNVFDVTWAGDTFLAALTYWLDSWYLLEDAVKLANKASGIVVEKFGTSTVTAKELWL